MNEFEAAKVRYEKKKQKQAEKAEVVPIKEPPKPDAMIVTIIDNGEEHRFHFGLEGISSTRLAAQRGKLVYQKLLEGFVKKEFGRWRLLPTR